MAAALGNIGSDRVVQPWTGSLEDYNLNPGWQWFVPGQLNERLFWEDEEEAPPMQIQDAYLPPVKPVTVGTPFVESGQDSAGGTPPSFSTPSNVSDKIALNPVNGRQMMTADKDSSLSLSPPSLDSVLDALTPNVGINMDGGRSGPHGTKSYTGKTLYGEDIPGLISDKGPGALGFIAGRAAPSVPLLGAGIELAGDLIAGRNNPTTWGKAAGALVGAPLGPFGSWVASGIGGNLGEQYSIDSALGRGAGFWSSLGHSLGMKSTPDYIRDMYDLSNENIVDDPMSPAQQQAFLDAEGKVKGSRGVPEKFMSEIGPFGPGSITDPTPVPAVHDERAYDPSEDALGVDTVNQAISAGLDGMSKGPGFDQGPSSWTDPDTGADDTAGHQEGADHEMADDW